MMTIRSFLAAVALLAMPVAAQAITDVATQPGASVQQANQGDVSRPPVARPVAVESDDRDIFGIAGLALAFGVLVMRRRSSSVSS